MLATVGADELRAAYRAALRRTHPDVAGSTRTANVDTAALVDAYRILRDDLAAAPPPVELAGTGVTVEGDTVAADLPAGDLFAMLVDVGDAIGELSYVDEQAGLLEIVAELAGYGHCSIVLSLQGRATGVTEAFCTVEPLGAGPAPPPEAVAELLGGGLRALLARTRGSA